ncbi:hypothetical protein TNCV_4737451 [Trichonephila clavipes]|nr:hypothetical protein TNCV_4737451 [Trichonephila clavipes]
MDLGLTAKNPQAYVRHSRKKPLPPAVCACFAFCLERAKSHLSNGSCLQRISIGQYNIANDGESQVADSEE